MITIDPTTFTAVSAVTAILVQLLKQIFLDPRQMPNSQRNAILYTMNYLINLGLVLAFAVTSTKGLSGSQALNYAFVALLQSVGAHFGYKVLSKGDTSAPTDGLTGVFAPTPPTSVSTTPSLGSATVNNTNSTATPATVTFPTVPRPDIGDVVGPNV